MAQEVKRIPKREFDALCPYCRSKAVFFVTPYRVEDSVPGNPSALSGIIIETWSCAVCYRTFELS